MTRDELLSTNSVYKDKIDEWTFNQLAYEGGKKLIEAILIRHPRESSANHATRKNDGICYNYTRGVIDIYSFYLTEQHPVRELGLLKEDPLFKMFETDCDMQGTNFEHFINGCQKLASVFGAIGVLVDKHKNKEGTKLAAINDKVYPYCAPYTLPNILDWTFTRNERTGRPRLSYLKLKEANGSITIWTLESWENWELQDNAEPVLARGGELEIKEIPFVWLENIKSITNPQVGMSDITEIALITASIIRDISCGDEVIKYAGFPMLRKPMRTISDNTPDISGESAVLEFDADKPDSKPDWLEAPTKEPIEAITNWINSKIAEIFQAAHLSGVHAHEKSDQVRSGVAMRYEFQQLTRVLTKKSVNLNEAEMNIIRLYNLWQGTTDNDISVTRPNDFSGDDLTAALESLVTANGLVSSITFNRQLQKSVVRKTLSDETTDTLDEIYKEIDNSEIINTEQ